MKTSTPTPEDVREKEVLTPEELAVVLGCGRTTAYSLLKSGEIPSYRVGRLRRIERADAERWRAERKAAEQQKNTARA